MKNNYRSIVSMISMVAVATVALAFAGAKSGLQPGEMVSAFEPTHVTGPDAKTATCPVCKYGAVPAVQVWVHGDSVDNVSKIAKELEASIEMEGPEKLRAFVVFVKSEGTTEKQIVEQLSAIALKSNLKHVALAYVNGSKDPGIEAYKINLGSDVKNTVMVYHDRKVDANFVNLKSDEKSLAGLKSALMKACGMKN